MRGALPILLSAARRRPPEAMKVRVSRDFVDADLTAVVQFLGQAMGRNVYLGPGIEGKVTVSLRSVPPLAGLKEVLAVFAPQVACQAIGDKSLIVAVPDCRLTALEDVHPLPRKGLIRQEILLDRAPAAKVIGALQGRFPAVELIPHPTMNGFYAVGTRSDIVQLKNAVPELDVLPDQLEPPPVREFVQIKYGDLEEIRSLLETLIPDAVVQTDAAQSTLVLEGTPGVVEQAKELLDQLDRPLEQVVLECKLVRLTETSLRNLPVEWEDSSQSASLRIGRFKRSQSVTLAPFSPPSNGLISPRLALQNDQPGSIQTGDKIPIVLYDPKLGNFRTDDQEIGLNLESTTTVEDGGAYVHCRFHGQFTILKELLANHYPQTHTTKFEAEINLKDGETAILGALLPCQEALEAVTAIPLLADLPVLGHLFRDIDANGSVDLMVTPNVMK